MLPVDATAGPATRPDTRQRLAAVVANPTKLDDATSTRGSVTEALRAAGWQDPLWIETTAEDPGYGAAQEALDRQADLVIACGGDGTVRAVLTVLAGTAMPLAILPAGTGNLLARNLGLPLDLDAAVGVALGGRDRTLDVGRIEPSEAGGRHERFAVMAGVGLDAVVMRDAPEQVKARVGWPAYVLAAFKHLRTPGVRVTLVVDGGAPVHTRAQTVVVGNMGKLQGGIELLRDAVPDDGRLDVAVVNSHGLVDWVRIVSRVVTRREPPDHRFITLQCTSLEVTLRHPQPRQVDGDLLDPSPILAVEIEPGAIVIRVPEPDPASG
jgi:diacylglycerol kinase (ATP)